MKYSANFNITENDVCGSAVSIGALMRYMQKAAYAHMASIGPSADDLRSQGRAFMLSRVRTDILSQVSVGDEITVTTWATDSAGVSFGRCFEIESGGRVAALSESVWVMYDFMSKRIVRVSDAAVDYGYAPPLGLEMPRRLSYPCEPELLYDREIVCEDIDENHHVNNAVYADILCGCIREVTSGDGVVSSMYINYSNEIKLGDTMKIYFCDRGGEKYFRTVRGDGKCNVEAQVTVV